MKQVLKLRHSNIEIEAGTASELFEKAAQMTEVFGERECGLCKSENIRPSARVVKHDGDNLTYCEWHCTDCGARLSLGRSKDKANLFPKRRLLKDGKPASPKEKSGTYGDHNGWTKFKGDVGHDDE